MYPSNPLQSPKGYPSDPSRQATFGDMGRAVADQGNTSLSLIVVVTGEPLTPALLRLTVKFSGPSTSTSSTVARLTLASVAPAARSLAPCWSP